VDHYQNRTHAQDVRGSFQVVSSSLPIPWNSRDLLSFVANRARMNGLRRLTLKIAPKQVQKTGALGAVTRRTMCAVSSNASGHQVTVEEVR
jgi:hypothetical protein